MIDDLQIGVLTGLPLGVEYVDVFSIVQIELFLCAFAPEGFFKT